MRSGQLTIFALFLLGVAACNIPGCGFDLEVQLFEPRGSGTEIKEGSVQVQFGHAQPLPAQALDENGRTQFKAIPNKFLNDTVHLIYHPVGNKRFRILEQYAYTAAESKNIKFTLDFPPDFTTLQWSLRDQTGEGIVDATITIDNKIILKTSTNGYFTVAIPKPAGEKAHFKVEKDGKTIMDRDVVIFPEYQRLTADQ